MSDPTTNDQGVSLVGITRNAFKPGTPRWSTRTARSSTTSTSS